MMNERVVCTFLKVSMYDATHRFISHLHQLPPEQQRLCVLCDITAMFPPPLDFLNLSMATVDAQFPPFRGSAVKSDIDGLRKKAAEICLSFISVIALTKDFVDTSLQLVDLLDSNSPEENVLQHMSAIASQAGANAKQVDKIRQETSSFSSSVSSTERGWDSTPRGVYGAFDLLPLVHA
jgi:hypothetical protein